VQKNEKLGTPASPIRIAPYSPEQLRRRIAAVCRERAWDIQVAGFGDGRLKATIKVESVSEQRFVNEHVLALPEMFGSGVSLEVIVEPR
jgi:hypothetical protein